MTVEFCSFTGHNKYLVSTVNPDIEEFDLSDVLAASSEKTETSEKDVGVGHETDGLDGVAGVAPSATVGVEPRITGEM